jgi:hypothetical protein
MTNEEKNPYTKSQAEIYQLILDVEELYLSFLEKLQEKYPQISCTIEVDKIQLYEQSSICGECNGVGFFCTYWENEIVCVYCAGTGKELIYKQPIYIKTAEDIYTVGAAAHRNSGIIQSSKESRVLKPLITLKFNK